MLIKCEINNEKIGNYKWRDQTENFYSTYLIKMDKVTIVIETI